MKILFLGDIIGRSGRRLVRTLLPGLREKHAADLVIANAENSAGGFGLNRKSLEDMQKSGVDFFTTGNHVWDKAEGVSLLGELDNIVRPANYPEGAPGSGVKNVPGTNGRVAVINLQGRVFMPAIDCPFRCIDRYLRDTTHKPKILIVDVHGEATSEKVAMGWYLDGRVSMVLGTHTHVPTRDCRILPKGTGYVTDVGMTGSYDSVIGVKKEAVIRRFLNMRPTRFEVAKKDLRCDYVVAEVDESTGMTVSIDHLQTKLED